MMRRVIPLVLIFAFFSLTPVFAQDNSSTIAGLIQTRPELSQFSALLNLADPSVLETLNDPDAELTLFAPTDQAFAAFAQELTEFDSNAQFFLQKDSLEAVLEDQDLVTDLLLYHLTEGKLDALAEVEEAKADSLSFITLDGALLHMSATFTNTGKWVREEGIRINGEVHIDVDIMGIEASNGIIYLIDMVLLPETRTIAETIAYSATDPEYPDFTIIWQILQTADPAILELLSDPSADVSFFVPFDTAFDNFSKDEITSLAGDSAAATAFLNHYISSDLIYAFQLSSLVNEDGVVEIEMLDGSIVTLTLVEDSFFNEFYFDDAYVGLPDWYAKNGMIHYLDNLPGAEG